MTNRVLLALVSAGAALALVVPPAGARTQTTLDLYKGEAGGQSGVVVGSWGSGEAKESEEYVYVGGKSLRVTTHGEYQGIRLMLNPAVDLKPALADPTAYLQFIVRLPSADSAGYRMGGSGFPGLPGGRGGLKGGSSGAPGGGGYGEPGGTVRMLRPKPMTALRFVLVTTDNQQIDALLDTSGAHRENDDWSSVAVPLASIDGLKQAGGSLKEIRVFGNAPAVFYLGQVRVIRDETPIAAESLADMTVARNDIITFTGSATAGPIPLVYQWTFVPVREGTTAAVNNNMPVDAEGRVVKHQFRKSGDYTVVLTVRDRYGLKKPAITTCNVHVTL